MTINYVVQGLTELCCDYPVMQYPGLGSRTPIIVNCDGAIAPVIGEVNTVNGDDTCRCPRTTPVEQTTWGRVKVLYYD